MAQGGRRTPHESADEITRLLEAVRVHAQTGDLPKATEAKLALYHQARNIARSLKAAARGNSTAAANEMLRLDNAAVRALAEANRLIAGAGRA